MDHQFDDDHHANELDTLGRSFLIDLIPSIKAYAYDGELQLSDIIDSELSNAVDCFLLCSGKESIETIVNPDSSIITSTFVSSFDLSEGLLLMKMPSRTHTAASDEINSLLRIKLLPMGLYNAIQGFPGTTIRSETSARGKQPDYGWGPKRIPRRSNPNQRTWPSIVLEVAVTESDPKLNSDVRYWLSPDDGNVKMCLTMRIDRQNKRIRMESWLRGEEIGSNLDPTRIRRYQAIYAHKTRESDTKFVITGDCPFIIPFKSLMLREIDRKGARQESDILFSEADLERVAKFIWDAEWE